MKAPLTKDLPLKESIYKLFMAYIMREGGRGSEAGRGSTGGRKVRERKEGRESNGRKSGGEERGKEGES